MSKVGSSSVVASASTNTHALDLEAGSSQEATAADHASLDITGDFTLEAWVKVESNPGEGAAYIVAGKGKSASTFPAYCLELFNDAGNLYCRGVITNSGGSALGLASTGGATFTTGTWIHFAVTFDAATGDFVVYKNGVSADSGNIGAQTIESNAVVFSIGSDPDGKFFDGIVDDVRVWNDVRTSGEISANYQKELIGTEANLVAYWKLNNTNDDETSNNNDLTVNTGTFVTDIPF